MGKLRDADKWKYVATEAFYGTSDFTKRFEKNYDSLIVVNTGAAPLTFKVRGITFDLPPGYSFDEIVGPFSYIEIFATDRFHGYVRDEKPVWE